jgi:hypothetical protein
VAAAAFKNLEAVAVVERIWFGECFAVVDCGFDCRARDCRALWVEVE